LAQCDICGGKVVGRQVTRKLYSAQRLDKIKDAAWATSRVTLHFSDFREHDVLVCRRCRREALRFYLRAFVPFAVTAALWTAWALLQPVVAANVPVGYVLLPALVPLILLLSAPSIARRRYGMGEVQFGETPLRMFSLDNYLIYRLTQENPDRVYWTPKWYRYYESRLDTRYR